MNVKSTLSATQIYLVYAKRDGKGRVPEITIAPGDNSVSEAKVKDLKTIDLFNKHVENGYIEVSKS